jgi:hypothetical protein
LIRNTMRSSRCAARYLSAPLLLDGTHKFDIRLYVLMCVLSLTMAATVAAPLQHTTSAESLSASSCAIGPAGRSSGGTFAAQRYSHWLLRCSTTSE